MRNWPGPRIAWACISERIAPYLHHPRHVPLLIGCDCSVVVGTTQALMNVSAENVHVLYIDGDFDDAPPDPKRCQSAASCAVWLLTHGSPFWTGPPLRPSQVTVIGWTNPSRSEQAGIALWLRRDDHAGTDGAAGTKNHSGFGFHPASF